MMVHLVTKLLLQTLKLLSNLSFSSQIHLDQEVTTYVFSVKDGNGLMELTLHKNQ